MEEGDDAHALWRMCCCGGECPDGRLCGEGCICNADPVRTVCVSGCGVYDVLQKAIREGTAERACYREHALPDL